MKVMVSVKRNVERTAQKDRKEREGKGRKGKMEHGVSNEKDGGKGGIDNVEGEESVKIEVETGNGNMKKQRL